jgi:cyanophycinase
MENSQGSFSFRVQRASGWIVAVVVLAAGPAWADEAKLPDPANPIEGRLMICGGGRLPEAILNRFIEFAGGEQGRIVLISTASDYAGTDDLEARIQTWRRQKVASLQVFHAPTREHSDQQDFCKPLIEATGVWFMGGMQSRVTDAYLGTHAEKCIREVLARGGVIGGTSAGAAIMSKVMIRGGFPDPELGTGFGFIPGAIVDQHFIKRNRQERLLRALQQRPGLVGLGIDEGTALIVDGRGLSVMGESEVVVCLPESETRPLKIQKLKEGDRADLVAYSRAAIARAKSQPVVAAAPEISKGTLVIAGGGEIPKEAAKRFLDAAGGPEAPVVVVSTALGEEAPSEAVLGWLRELGAKNVRQIHAHSRREVAEDSVLTALRDAHGVWFTGGRQWRLVDVFLDTPAEKLIRDVLQRGGVIGGASAGATIQGSYLVRGNPVGNTEIMAEGYERGFGLLPGVAIDQHFAQRNRFDDMATLKRTFPELIGLGVDEATALIVQGHSMEVVGRHKVAVYDKPVPEEGVPAFELLQPGEKYDLKDHRRLAGDDDDSAKPQTILTSEVKSATSASAEEPAQSLCP